MLKFLIIDDDCRLREKLALELKSASDLVQQYPHISKLDGRSIHNIINWEKYDSIFIRTEGGQIDSEGFKYADYVRDKEYEKLMVFYSEGWTQNTILHSYLYYPMVFLQIPWDRDQVKEIVSKVTKFHNPYRLFIDTKDGCEMKEPLEILYYDAKENVVYADECIKVNNREKEYQKYMVDVLKMEGFIKVKNRFWINRYWKDQDNPACRKALRTIIDFDDKGSAF